MVEGNVLDEMAEEISNEMAGRGGIGFLKSFHDSLERRNIVVSNEKRKELISELCLKVHSIIDPFPEIPLTEQ